MQAIKDKWKTYRSYKKVQNLWNDYKKVSHLQYQKSLLLPPLFISFLFYSDNPETLNKFELFVDTMQGYLRNMASKNQNTSQVDNVFGHCNEMMSSMIQFLNQ